jgi:conjugative relaxase-like TrwC/TraI family protein
MSITKLMAGTASKYYENTVDSVLSDHGGGMANYYNAPGTPPGVWLGSGLGRYGLKAGTQASNKQVHRLYDGLRQPNTGKKLVRMNDESIKAGKVVGGYDLTFHMPKSVNILWASGDKDVRAAIMKAHKEAMGESVAWFETHVASSRSGAGGVVRQRAKGVVAVAYTHWDSRDHDPHLHDHVLISNLVERADGKAGALDGGSAFRAAVAISERHTNLLMDKLTQSLGVQWHRRDRPRQQGQRVRDRRLSATSSSRRSPAGTTASPTRRSSSSSSRGARATPWRRRGSKRSTGRHGARRGRPSRSSH